MLKRRSDRPCECHGGIWPERTYRWHSYWYCLACLHSIGINAAGNYCTPKQYREGWQILNGSQT